MDWQQTRNWILVEQTGLTNRTLAECPTNNITLQTNLLWLIIADDQIKAYISKLMDSAWLKIKIELKLFYYICNRWRLHVLLFSLHFWIQPKAIQTCRQLKTTYFWNKHQTPRLGSKRDEKKHQNNCTFQGYKITALTIDHKQINNRILERDFSINIDKCNELVTEFNVPPAHSRRGKMIEGERSLPIENDQWTITGRQHARGWLRHKNNFHQKS